MKHAFFIVVAGLMAGSSAQGQKLTEKQVPVIVKNALAKEYPGIKASWDKEDANYEASFKQDGKSMSTVIDGSGAIVETEINISVTDLPKPVLDFMQKNYSGAKIVEAARIVKANGDINYEVEVHHKDIVFDAEGKFIKEVQD